MIRERTRVGSLEILFCSLDLGIADWECAGESGGFAGGWRSDESPSGTVCRCQGKRNCALYASQASGDWTHAGPFPEMEPNLNYNILPQSTKIYTTNGCTWIFTSATVSTRCLRITGRPRCPSRTIGPVPMTDRHPTKSKSYPPHTNRLPQNLPDSSPASCRKGGQRGCVWGLGASHGERDVGQRGVGAWICLGRLRWPVGAWLITIPWLWRRYGASILKRERETYSFNFCLEGR